MAGQKGNNEFVSQCSLRANLRRISGSRAKTSYFLWGSHYVFFKPPNSKLQQTAKKKHLLDAGQLAHKFVAVSGCKKI